MELLVTFVFTNVILNVKYNFGQTLHLANALLIGLTLFAMICVAGPVSGGCINPAVGVMQVSY